MGIAIGSSGAKVLSDLRGETDLFGNTLEVTEVGIADEIASAAELVKGNVSRIPAVVVRGFSYQSDEEATMQDVLRDPQNDLFR